MILYLVCDISGSMTENGKNMLVRGIARATEQYLRLFGGAASIKLVLWNKTASVVDWNIDDEFPEAMLECSRNPSGSSDAPGQNIPLCELIQTMPEGKYLFLTDGWWMSGNDDVSRLIREMPPDRVRIFLIGADANPLLEGNKSVFSTDDFFAALDGWLPDTDDTDANGEKDEW